MPYADLSCWTCFWQATVSNLSALSKITLIWKMEGNKSTFVINLDPSAATCIFQTKLKLSQSCFHSFDTCLSIFLLYIFQFFLLRYHFLLQLPLSFPCFLFFPLCISKDAIELFLQICKAFPQNISWILTSERESSIMENSNFKSQY